MRTPHIKVSAKYENWRMEAPDGTFLGYCDEKKANWYIFKKKLATLHGHKIFRLIFQPKVKDTKRDLFRETKCVVCGTTKRVLTRHHVIPKIYRQPMPVKLKKNRSRDIVLLCEQCHNRYESLAWKFKHNIVETYGVPLSCAIPEAKAVSYFNTLQRHGAKMPKEKREYFEKELEKLKKEDGVIEALESCCNKTSKKSMGKFREKISRDRSYHGESVISILSQKENGLECFIEAWRKHFVETMKPAFLPADWDD